jgi:hypothetical protein
MNNSMNNMNNINNNFIDDFFQKKGSNISLTTNCVRISQNIININPVPMYIKPTVDNSEAINTEFNIIAAGMNEKSLYIDKNQDEDKDFGIFTSQNAYVPYNNILNLENMYINEIKAKILEGINELLISIYNFKGQYEYKILNSWIQKYKNGNFLSPHNHISKHQNSKSETNKRTRVFSVAYYIDDGEPDVTQTYSGCITFMHNNNLIHVRPQSGTLLIWEDYLMHLVNPFYSKSNKERFMLSTNILITF